MLYTLSGAPGGIYQVSHAAEHRGVRARPSRGGVSSGPTTSPRTRAMGKCAALRHAAGHLPVRSYLAVPVISRSGGVIGGLFFGHADAGVFTDRAPGCGRPGGRSRGGHGQRAPVPSEPTRARGAAPRRGGPAGLNATPGSTGGRAHAAAGRERGGAAAGTEDGGYRPADRFLCGSFESGPAAHDVEGALGSLRVGRIHKSKLRNTAGRAEPTERLGSKPGSGPLLSAGRNQESSGWSGIVVSSLSLRPLLTVPIGTRPKGAL